MTRTSHAIAAALLIALALTHAGIAVAQRRADDDARERAQPLFQQGVSLVGEQRWSEALDAFVRARAIFESPILVFDIGYCQRALGQYVTALGTLRAFLAMRLEGVAATRRAEAEGYVRELEARIARLEVIVPPELARGADVLVDGRVVSTSARGRASARIDPGRHTVMVRRDGYAPFFEDRVVAPGAQISLRAELAPLPARLVIASNVRDAAVHLDGRRIGRVPFDAEVEPGRHRLEVRSSGYVAHRSTINLLAGGSARVSADLSKEPIAITERWWFWTALGVAVAGAAAVTYVVVRPEPEPPPYEDGNLGWVVMQP